VLAGAAEHTDDPAAKSLKKTSVDAISTALDELSREHEQAQRSYRLVCVAGSWQFVQPAGIRAVESNRSSDIGAVRRASRSPRWKRSPSSPTVSPLPGRD